MACGSWAPSPVEGTAALSGKLDQCRSLWKWQPSLASSSSCLLGPNLLLIHSGTHAITIGFINHPSSHKKRFFFLLVAVAGLSLRRRRQNFLILIYLQSSCLWFCDVRNVNVHCPLSMSGSGSVPYPLPMLFISEQWKRTTTWHGTQLNVSWVDINWAAKLPKPFCSKNPTCFLHSDTMLWNCWCSVTAPLPVPL